MRKHILETPDQASMADCLRQATERVHLRLHQHPLIVELLNRPSMDRYGTVLLSLFRFYKAFEQRLVNDARILGFETLYPRPERTEWLIDDLDALNCDLGQSRRLVAEDAEFESRDIGGLVGRLYVVRGSALGGLRILNRLSRDLDIRHCCQFLNAGGAEVVASNWRAFQEFCNQSRMCEASRSSAAVSAQSAFSAIDQCFTRTLWQRNPILPTC